MAAKIVSYDQHCLPPISEVRTGGLPLQEKSLLTAMLLRPFPYLCPIKCPLGKHIDISSIVQRYLYIYFSFSFLNIYIYICYFLSLPILDIKNNRVVKAGCASANVSVFDSICQICLVFNNSFELCMPKLPTSLT